MPNTNNKVFKYGKNQYIFDINEKKYLDLRMGAGTMILGHSNKHIINDIKKKLDDGFVFATECNDELILKSLLKNVFPWYKKFVLCNTGSEAIMRIIRISRGFTNKNKICILAGCWHGSYNEVLVDEDPITHEPTILSSGLSKDLLNNIIVLPNNIVEIQNILELYSSEIAMVLIEPVQQNIPNINVKDFLEKIREITKRNNILLGFDEIITGFRFFPGSAQEYFNVYSDLACFGKIISGGLPIGVVSMSEEISNKIDSLNKPIYFGGTFSGNPISTFICYKTISYLKENAWIYDNIKKKIVEFSNDINKYCIKNNIDFQIMHAEYFFRFIFTKKKITSKRDRLKYEQDRNIQNKFYKFLLDNGIFIGSNPLCFFSIEHTENDIIEIKNKVIDALNFIYNKYTLDNKGVIRIDKLLENETINKIINKVNSNQKLIDYEPFSNSPYRSVLELEDIKEIDKTFTNKIQNIINEKLDTEFDITQITVHFKDKWIGAEEQWHQDYNYNNNTHIGPPENFYRIFIALDEHSEENGSMIFIPESHKEGILNYTNILSIHNYQKKRTPTDILDNIYKKYDIEKYTLNKGEAILFNSLILHSSSSNQSPYPRRALQIQLIKKGTIKKDSNEIMKFQNNRKNFEITELERQIKLKKNIKGEFSFIFDEDSSGNIIYKATEKTFDKIYENNIDAWSQTDLNNSYYKYTRSKLVEILNDFSYNNILEIGCGNGFSTNYLRENTIKSNVFYGCDISEKAINHASINYPLTTYFVHNCIKKFNINVIKFDYVIFGDLLWYILLDLKQCISNALEILNDNGKIIFYNAFLENQKYGQDIINGYDGLIEFFEKEFPNNTITYKYKSKLIDYKYLGCIIIKK